MGIWFWKKVHSNTHLLTFLSGMALRNMTQNIDTTFMIQDRHTQTSTRDESVH
jgi:hypothetical protein